MDLSAFDTRFRVCSTDILAGVDEAGRGALAGPVVAACVILPGEFNSTLIQDSKVLSARGRSIADALIRSHATDWGIGSATHTEIDTIGIAQATFLAMRRAVAKLRITPTRLLVDGPFPPRAAANECCIIDGDAQSLSIAAASILAKVFRDKFMTRLSRSYPAYGFDMHKGYLTRVHRQRLIQHGPCHVHRFSFEPLRSVAQPRAHPV